jgi:hypothetical protein
VLHPPYRIPRRFLLQREKCSELVGKLVEKKDSFPIKADVPPFPVTSMVSACVFLVPIASNA